MFQKKGGGEEGSLFHVKDESFGRKPQGREGGEKGGGSLQKKKKGGPSPQTALLSWQEGGRKGGESMEHWVSWFWGGRREREKKRKRSP